MRTNSDAAYPWRPNNNSHTPTFCHNSRQRPSIDDPSCCSLSSYPQCLLYERNHDNCFGHNRNLPVRPSYFPMAITGSFYRVPANKTWGSSRLAELGSHRSCFHLSKKWFTCHYYIAMTGRKSDVITSNHSFTRKKFTKTTMRVVRLTKVGNTLVKPRLGTRNICFVLACSQARFSLKPLYLDCNLQQLPAPRLVPLIFTQQMFCDTAAQFQLHANNNQPVKVMPVQSKP